AQALANVGIPSGLRINGLEPIVALAELYGRPVNLAQAAAEFGLTVEQYRNFAGQIGGTAAANFRQLDLGGLIQRDAFEAAFRQHAPMMMDRALLATEAEAACHALASHPYEPGNAGHGVVSYDLIPDVEATVATCGHALA